MTIFDDLKKIWDESNEPFLIGDGESLRFADLAKKNASHLDPIKSGDVVALIGDFDIISINNLLRLISVNAIVVPLTKETASDHEYFFEVSGANWSVEGLTVKRITTERARASELVPSNHPGLILFSTGTTGRPKAILHDLSTFLVRFKTPRPTLRTLNFLLFDHIGGLNTLLHTLFNRGTVISIKDRSVERVLEICNKFSVEVLPTTPTFLRMLLLSGVSFDSFPQSVRVITYGTERMLQSTLDDLCQLLPDVDFRQTFGMSELGILRVKSESRDSLFMKIGGEGVEWRSNQGVLEIKSQSRMLGYLNAESPFDLEGWYNTKDVIEIKGDFIKVVGRTNEVVNVGGLKFMLSEVERVAAMFPGIGLVKATSRKNPITGEHVELVVEPSRQDHFDLESLRSFLSLNLQTHMVPRRVAVGSVAVGHRFKRL